MKNARSVDEILSCAFLYDMEETGKIVCNLCNESDVNAKSGVFIYDKELGLCFQKAELLPAEFRNMKRSIQRHLQSTSHMDSLIDKKEKLAAQVKTKNELAGMNLGRLCMKNYIMGRPYSDFENDVLVSKLNGVTVGELNHGRKFPAALRPYVQEVVHKRVTKYLQTPLIQTGFLPPLCLSADKGTYKHRSRQFLSCVTE